MVTVLLLCSVHNCTECIVPHVARCAGYCGQWYGMVLAVAIVYQHMTGCRFSVSDISSDLLCGHQGGGGGEFILVWW